MDTPRQRTIKIGKASVGLLGLDVAMNAVLADADISEDEAITRLVLAVERQNYIPPGAAGLYREALAREYRRLRQGDAAGSRELCIRILSSGCVTCDRLYTLVIDIVAEQNLAADVEKVSDPDEIWRFGLVHAPALVINGQVKSSGRMPSRAEIEAWLRDAQDPG